MLLIKNPAGANEAIRTLETAASRGSLVVALNDAIADGRDVSWIWDVDFEPLLARPRAHRRRAATAPPSWRCASPTRGLPRERLEVVPASRRRSTAASSSSPAGGELVVLPTYTAMLALRAIAAERGPVRPYWETRRVRIRVGHLYPDYLNIYADRGNIAVLARRAALRGHELDVTADRPRRARSSPASADLLYVGGGQDREQALVAPDLAAQGAGDPRPPSTAGAALLAVCGGYQLLGRGYRGRDGLVHARRRPLPARDGRRRAAHDRRRAARLRARPGERRTLAGFENHAGRTTLDPGAEPLGRVVAGFGNDGESGFEGCRVGPRDRHVPARAAAAAQPVARRLAARAGARARDGRGAAALEPLDDELEAQAHAVSARRARERGGRR